MTTRTTKFTPGPWRLDASTAGCKEILTSEDQSLAFTDGLNDDEEDEANGRLMAAGPEMYAVLQRISEHFRDTDAPLGIDARTLLARIDGEPA